VQEELMVVIVSERGSVVIRADLRRKYNLQPGSKISMVDYGGALALVPAMTRPVRQAAGMLGGRPPLTRALLGEHKKERSPRHHS
jgi:bifunctional DNA-binding transcriptional regulator/antitoxin component of YhaV-PrlF toxin-antitoxin module